MKIVKVENIHDGRKYHHDQYFYWCPGCDQPHCFALKPEGGHHTWNGSYEKPTIQPSLLEDHVQGKRCHSFIVDGSIRFLGDCYHALRNQTMQLPEIERAPGKFIKKIE